MSVQIPEEQELEKAEVFLDKPKKDYCRFEYYGGLRRHDKVVVDVDLTDYVRKDLLAAILTFGLKVQLNDFDGITEALILCVKLELIKEPLKIREYSEYSLNNFDDGFRLAKKLATDCNIQKYIENEISTFDDYQDCVRLLLEKFHVSYTIGY